jgi:hypothetical protein
VNLRDVLAQRREAVNRFCRIAGLEQDLMEEWLEDTADAKKYSAWSRHKRWVVAALNDWQQATDALFSALEKRQ